MPPICRPSRPEVEILEGRTLLSGANPAAPARPVFLPNQVYEDVNGRREALDVYSPGGPAPAGGRPVALAIHGGGWRRYDKGDYGRAVSALTRDGYVVVSVNYQLSAPGAPSWPADFEDVRAAVRWVRSNAARLGVDPDRIAAFGESAGGHLADLLATEPDGPPGQTDPPGTPSARVEAVVDFFGPTDLAALDAQSAAARPAVEQFLGGTPAQVPGRYADASPLDHVAAGDPPTLIVQGTADPIVPPAQSQAYAAALSAAGVPARLVEIPGAGHGFRFRVGGLNLLPVVLAFLDAAWKDTDRSL